MTTLPTAGQLQRLPLRAVAAYAARAARRARIALVGVMGDEIIEEALSIVEDVASAARIDQLDSASAALAASRVAEAMGGLNTAHERRASLCICAAARTAYAILQAADQPARTQHYAAYAARSAHSVANSTDLLGEAMGITAAKAARADYEMLLRTFGECESVHFGEPMDVSDSSILGRLMGDG